MSTPRVIVITGASGGIGRTCAVALSHTFPSQAQPEPLVLVLSGRREAELEATAKECREGTTVEICVGDVSSDKDVQRMFGTVKEKYGRVDLLFNVSRAGRYENEPASRVETREPGGDELSNTR
jgi:NADP-dependent 3-hydroxy acid dehydrogenase YdfG